MLRKDSAVAYLVHWSLPKQEFGRSNPVQWFVFFAITIVIDSIYIEETKEWGNVSIKSNVMDSLKTFGAIL